MISDEILKLKLYQCPLGSWAHHAHERIVLSTLYPKRLFPLFKKFWHDGDYDPFLEWNSSYWTENNGQIIMETKTL